LEELDVDGSIIMIIIIMFLKDTVREGLALFHLPQDKEKWQTFVDTSVTLCDL
jgi:hypothetical protein